MDVRLILTLVLCALVGQAHAKLKEGDCEGERKKKAYVLILCGQPISEDYNYIDSLYYTI